MEIDDNHQSNSVKNMCVSIYKEIENKVRNTVCGGDLGFNLLYYCVIIILLFWTWETVYYHSKKKHQSIWVPIKNKPKTFLSNLHFETKTMTIF